MTESIDPITLAVLAGRMEQIADEMDATLFRAAFNPIIAEAHDASHGLYHPTTGDTLVQGKSGLPIFVGVMSFAVKAVIEKAAEHGDLADGDIYIFNDAHLGGTHLNDMRLVRPYFHEGKPFCYLGSVGHWHDLGGAVPGNYNPAATDAFQEAFVLPPVRLAKAGVLQTDIVDILMRNTRLPQSAEGDLNGQLGALDLGVKRLAELLAEYGAETVRAALDALQNRAEMLMRAELEELPNGRWEAEDFLDNDGITDEPLAIRVALEIKDDTMTLDFSGTADRCAGPVNIALPTAVATAYVAIKHIFPALPANAGVMRPINVVIPENSLLSAPFPAPVGGYTETILRMIDVIFAAASQAAPDRVVANAYGTINALSIAGKRKNGQPWVMFSFYGGGHGGSLESDGLNHGNAPISTATIPPMEILEAAYPVMFRQWRDLLFLHWEYPVEAIQATLPNGLFVDTFAGKAYLGVVPFFMQKIRPRFLPAVPGISDFMELNLRTYVHDKAGVPGVWFYSLDANQWMAVQIARRFFHLPYEYAKMKSSRTPEGSIGFES
ncbi:MAG: hydantoinase B/oxoprolinase family protein, partial [Beijerinckiaceae bacterium]|nr:hydantoinase B/oxoprolinase family protein [Beijerinckiaceae bacterium]